MEPKKAIVVSVKQSTPIQRNLELSCVGELSPDNIHELCDVLHNVVSEFRSKINSHQKVNTCFALMLPGPIGYLYDELCVTPDDRFPTITFTEFGVKYHCENDTVSEFTVKFLFKDLPDDCVWLNVIASA